MGKLRVLAAGELNPDLILSQVQGLPEFGQERVAGVFEMHLGSSTAIFAAQLSRLGAEVSLVARIGGDTLGEFCRERLQEIGVDTSLLIEDRESGTGVTVSLSYPQDRMLITYLGCISRLQESDVTDEMLDGYDHMHISSYYLQTSLQRGITRLLQRAKERGLTISLDTGDDPAGKFEANILEVLPLVDYFLPNERELIAITKTSDYRRGLESLKDRVPTIAVKLGSKGAALQQGDEFIYVPGFTIEVADTTGAGDSFDAGFIFARLNGLSLREALVWGNACGALCAANIGGASGFDSAEAVREFIAKEAGKCT
ncbi:MAG: carbohydrate kinase family protein [Firmicutes bacterium]|nr:carbohydrate kinase family protein [Bacillota bacterium]